MWVRLRGVGREKKRKRERNKKIKNPRMCSKKSKKNKKVEKFVGGTNTQQSESKVRNKVTLHWLIFFWSLMIWSKKNDLVG